METTAIGRARAPKGATPRRKQEVFWGLVFVSPWAIGFLLFNLVPMAASLGFTLFRLNLSDPSATSFVGLDNWVRLLFQDPTVYVSVALTFLFGAVSLPIGMLAAFFLALLLNARGLRGKSIFRSLFFLPTMIPMVATVIIWKGVLNEHTGWVNQLIEFAFGVKATGDAAIRWISDPKIIYFTYSFMGLWGVGNTMLIFLAGLQMVPAELYEAAVLDGAGWWRRLVSVTIPQLSPVIFFNLLLALIGVLQYFLLPFVLNRGDGSPGGATNFIMVYFYKQAFGYFNMGYGATLAWVIFGISLALTVLLFKTSKDLIYYAGE